MTSETTTQTTPPAEPVHQVPANGSATPEERELMALLSAEGTNELEVERLATDPEGEELGYCGHVPARRHFKRDIMRRWGGGVYRVKSLSPSGRPIVADFTLPGESEPLTEEPVTRYHHLPRQPQVTGPYGDAPRPMELDRYAPSFRLEVEREREKVRDLEARLATERLEHKAEAQRLADKLERAQSDLAAAKEDARVNKMAAEMEKRLAQLTQGQQGAKSSEAAMAEIFKALAAQQAGGQQQMASMMSELAKLQSTQQASLLQVLMGNKTSTEDLLKLAGAFKSQTDPLEQLSLLMDMQQRLQHGDQEEEEEGTMATLVKTAAKIGDRFLGQQGAPQQVAQPHGLVAATAPQAIPMSQAPRRAPPPTPPATDVAAELAQAMMDMRPYERAVELMAAGMQQNADPVQVVQAMQQEVPGVLKDIKETVKGGKTAEALLTELEQGTKDMPDLPVKRALLGFCGHARAGGIEWVRALVAALAS